MSIMNHIDIKYAQLLLTTNFPIHKIKQRNPFLASLRCPICGDSQKNKRKMRGYFYVKKGKMNYRCHNCNAGMSFENFLKEINGALYNSYRLEKFKSSGREDVRVAFKKKNIVRSSGLDALFPKLSFLEEDHPARVYIRERKIPEKFLEELFYCDNSKKLFEVHSSLKERVTPDRLHDDAPRIIFPAYTRRGRLIGFTGRDISGKTNMRYTAFRLLDNYPFVYNIPRVNRAERIYVVEGVIDSLFLPNSLAVGNSNLSAVYPVVKNRKNTVLIFDNQPRNQHIAYTMEKAADMGFSIVVWPKTDGKDINEMIMSGMSVKDILTLINKHAYHGPEFYLNFMEWKKYAIKRETGKLYTASML